MKFLALALAAATAALACGSAHAALITYELTATANYSLGTKSRTGFIDILGVGDTANVVSQARSGGRTLELNGTDAGVESAPFAISIDLAGLGLFSVTDTSYVFDLKKGTLAGFGASGVDFIYLRSPLLDSYDLVSNLAPVTGSWFTTHGASVATTGGQLTISSFSDGQFSARIATPSSTAPTAAAAAPEPGTWALALLGFGAAGAALRRRRLGVHGGAATEAH